MLGPRGSPNTERTAFAQAGGIDLLTRAFLIHPASSTVVEALFKVVHNLARDAENKERIAAAGGIDRVVQAMAAHVGVAGVQEQGCWALKNLGVNAEKDAEVKATVELRNAREEEKAAAEKVKAAAEKVKAAAEKVKAAAEKTMAAEVSKGHECKFAFPFDTNGAGYYLGTNGKTEDFENPQSTGKVVAAMSSIGNIFGNSSNPSHLVHHLHDGRTLNYTQDKAESWVSVDLGERHSLVPSYYCLRHGGSNGWCRLQSWDFEGSIDGSSYTVLKAHKNDNSLPDQGFSVAAWEVEGGKQAYRHFRIRMTGKNSGPGGYNGHNYHTHSLCCAGIALYGMLLSR
jgi:hypothetical protein